MYGYLAVAVVVGTIGYFYYKFKSDQELSFTDLPSPSSPKEPTGKTGSAGASVSNTATSVKPAVKILFGTQTGTAERFAGVLLREAHTVGIPAAATDLDAYCPADLAEEKIVLFVVSTFGEGDPPDTMEPFYKWLKQTNDSLDHVRYAVFALGDRQYKHFCNVGTVVDLRMSKLGARRIYGLGCGDAGATLEEDFDEWRAELWAAVARELGGTINVDMSGPVKPEAELKVLSGPADELPFPKMASALEPSQKQPLYAHIVEKEELLKNTSGGTRSTLRIAFSIEGTFISYQSGDHLGILPRNPEKVVDEYLTLLNAHSRANDVVMLSNLQTGKNMLPAKVPLRVALEWYSDLCGPPKKATLRAIAHYCADPIEKEEFIALLDHNTASQNEYHKLLQKLRTVSGFLRKFPSCKVPVGHFLELMPRLMPRYFSISSDQLVHKTQIHVTVAIVEGGVCTQLLKRMSVGDSIPIFVRKSKFHLPMRAKQRSLILIGPGTGVAPLIGFCHRRRAWKVRNALGECMLFFGCRNRTEDYIYEDFLKSCVADGVISTLDVAFSREQDKKVYVQHRLADRSKEIWQILQAGGAVYICGDAKHMAKDVEEALLNIIMKHGKVSKEEAEHYLEEMERVEKYQKDVWSA